MPYFLKPLELGQAHCFPPFVLPLHFHSGGISLFSSVHTLDNEDAVICMQGV